MRQTDSPGDEQHLVFECPALRLREVYNRLFGDHATTRIQFMWQHDTHALAQFIKECVDAHGDPGPQSQASDQP